MSEEKYREFWIEYAPENKTHYEILRVFKIERIIKTFDECEIIRVISYDAYADLKAENEEMKTALRKCHLEMKMTVWRNEEVFDLIEKALKINAKE